MSKKLGLPQPLVSQHLAVLRQKGVIISHSEGLNTVCEISNSKIIKACDLMREVMIEQFEKTGKLAEFAKSRR